MGRAPGRQGWRSAGHGGSPGGCVFRAGQGGAAVGQTRLPDGQSCPAAGQYAFARRFGRVWRWGERSWRLGSRVGWSAGRGCRLGRRAWWVGWAGCAGRERALAGWPRGFWPWIRRVLEVGRKKTKISSSIGVAADPYWAGDERARGAPEGRRSETREERSHRHVRAKIPRRAALRRPALKSKSPAQCIDLVEALCATAVTSAEVQASPIAAPRARRVEGGAGDGPDRPPEQGLPWPRRCSRRSRPSTSTWSSSRPRSARTPPRSRASPRAMPSSSTRPASSRAIRGGHAEALDRVTGLTCKPGKNQGESIVRWPAAPGAQSYAIRAQRLRRPGCRGDGAHVGGRGGGG